MKSQSQLKSLQILAHRTSTQCLGILTVLFLMAVSASAYIPTKIAPPCALNPINPSVTICTPGNSATLSLPVHLVAGTKDTNPVQSIQVLVDGKVVYQTSSAALDVYLNNLSTGSHSVSVIAKDSTGASFSGNISIAVTANSGITQLRHIIFYVQENRSFDHYFGMLGQYRASKGLPNDIDGIPTNVTLYNTKGQPVSPFHLQTFCVESLPINWNSSWTEVDGGKMDGFMKVAPYTTADPSGTRTMGYYDQSELPYYYELATQFATSDRFFSPVMANTNPNRMYLFAATSFGHVNPDPPPAGGWTQPTIFDHLDQAGVSWRYYYQDNGSYLPQWSTYQRDAAKMVPIAKWYTDLQNEATLPSVIFIERGGPTGLDEHPGGTSIQRGMANTKKIVDVLMNSPSWPSSVFILSFDEAGGFFEHVIPASMVAPDNIPPMLKLYQAAGDFAHSGMRIPIIVISPWVKPHYVSHTWRDLTSILRLIETRFNVPPLTARDATADNMMEFFDFSSPRLLTLPPLPNQPTNGTCNFQLEKAPGY